MTTTTYPDFAAIGCTTDPGLEVLDLGDGQAYDVELDAAAPFDLAERAIAFAGMPPVDISRRTAFAGDYEWATWLVPVLRKAGVNVIAYPGWETRGRPRSSGPWTPRGVMWHHDASAKGPSPEMARFIAETGRPPGVPAPLGNGWIDRNGTWWILAAGRANHAGVGVGFGAIGEDMGNSVTLGFETDNTVGEDTPQAMYDSLVKGSRAILAFLGSDPDEWLAGHKEYAAGRKIDPDDIDMDRARVDVKRKAPAPAVPSAGPVKLPTPDPSPGVPGRDYPYPGPDHFTVNHRCGAVYVDKVKDWLNETTKGPQQLTGPTFTSSTRARVKVFQAEHAKRCKGDDPGVVGKKTWVALQHIARGGK